MKKKHKGPRIGFASFFVILTLGLILVLFDVGFSLGISFRIPKTNINLSWAGCLGEKEKAVDALPSYLKKRVAGNDDFLNHTMTNTIWKIEGCEMAVIGPQEGAPSIGIHFALK